MHMLLGAAGVMAILIGGMLIGDHLLGLGDQAGIMQGAALLSAGISMIIAWRVIALLVEIRDNTKPRD